MPLIIPPGYANAAFIFGSTTGTPPLVTTLGLDVSDVGGNFVLAANRAFTAYATALMPTTWNGVFLERVSLLIGSDGGNGSVDSSVAAVTGGRSLSTPPPLAQSAIARKTTNGLGRRSRGRMFLPATTAESEVDASGDIAPSRLTALNAALVNFFEALSTGSPGSVIPPVLLHSQAPVTPDPITRFITAPKVGWVRGRIR